MRRLIPLAIASVLVLACQDHVGIPHRLSPGETSAALVDADHGGTNDHARWLEPIVKTAQVENFGTFDPTVTSAQLHVKCVCVPDWDDPINAIDVYKVSDGSLMIEDDHYHAQVELSHLEISDGTDATLYVLVATVRPFGDESAPVVVAYADFRVLANGRATSSLSEEEIGLVGSKLPARIRLDVGVLADAARDALEDESYELPAGPLQDAVASYGDGEFSTTVVQPGVATEATFEEGDRTTAAFVFDGDEVLEDIVLFIGIPKENGEDICGDAFDFEKIGCKRALAVPLVGGEEAPSDVTSGFEFANEVEFCIATDIPESDHRLWQLIKIDDYGDGPEFEVLQQLNGDACNLIDEPTPPEVSLRTEPVDWIRHNVGKRVLDFLVTPLYADHSPTRMGSTLQDLSDLTAALLPELFGSLTDPDGDAVVLNDRSPDLATATAEVSGGDVTLTVTFHSGFADSTYVIWNLDMDQNVQTGFEGITQSNADSEIMGVDYLVDITGSAFESTATILQYDNDAGQWTTIASLTPTTLTNGYSVVVPLAQLGNDDGFFNFKVTTQTQLSPTSWTGIHDYISDLGLPPGETGLFDPIE
jgi:hypothetical protein